MSHLKERKEKICLNCKTELIGRYCHVCGQENLEPKETVWHLVQHFFNDITHFDGKFFSTVKYLLRKPGFLSLEYMNGRRASYLNPIRMYVFTSAIFFIIFFSLKRSDQILGDNGPNPNASKAGLQELVEKQTKLQKKLNEADEKDRQDYRESMSKLATELAYIRKEYGDTSTRKFDAGDLGIILKQAYEDSLKQGNLSPQEGARIGKKLEDINDRNSGSNFLGMHQGRYKSVSAYDSAQQKLPADQQDGWIKRKFMASLIHADEEYRLDKQRYMEHLKENILHSFPKILFFSLPFFALILNVLYFRRKQYYYVSHGIFTIHVYCAIFVLMLFTLLLSRLDDLLSWKWFHYVSIVLTILVVLYMLIYLYMAMRGFYKQGRFKTFVKYLIACSLATVINLILFVLFVVIAAITV